MNKDKKAIMNRAANKAAHKRVGGAGYKEITTPSISFMVGDTKDILESLVSNNRSKAIRIALHAADEAGLLKDLKI